MITSLRICFISAMLFCVGVSHVHANEATGNVLKCFATKSGLDRQEIKILRSEKAEVAEPIVQLYGGHKIWVTLSKSDRHQGALQISLGEQISTIRNPTAESSYEHYHSDGTLVLCAANLADELQ